MKTEDGSPKSEDACLGRQRQTREDRSGLTLVKLSALSGPACCRQVSGEVLIRQPNHSDTKNTKNHLEENLVKLSGISDLVVKKQRAKGKGRIDEF